MENKGVSVVINTFNRPDMLRESLTNMRQRTHYTPLEVVVADGGSEPALLPKYEEMKKDKLIDTLVLLPYKNKGTIRIHEHSACMSNTQLAGLQASRQEYPYIYFGADDLWYRTGWVDALVEMVDSDWAKRNSVKIVSGFNHWAQPSDYDTMKSVVPELYKSADGKVEGYASVWGGNWFMRKDEFYAMGGFANNLDPDPLPEYLKQNYEMILLERFKQKGWHWGTTMDTYVQTVALPNSSMVGNYHYEDPEETRKLTDWHHKNGIAIGVNWKDE